MLNDTTIMAVGLAALAIVSGMRGLGVAFAAVPFLGVFPHDLVNESSHCVCCSSLYVPGRRLKRIFGVLIVAMTAYKLYQIAT